MLQSPLQGRSLLHSKSIVIAGTLLPCPIVKNEYRLTVQRIGGPIRSHVCAVSPDRPYLLTSDRLPHVLPVADVLTVKNNLPIRSYYLRRNGRRGMNSLVTDDPQHCERHHHHDCQAYPKFAVFQCVSPSNGVVSLAVLLALFHRDWLYKVW